jgi:beta-lactamase class D/glyoxylase-like metal-dependent hydrolase (beta-lactamase superfamily II)
VKALFCAAILLASVQPARAADWNAPQEPFAVYGNTYYVGTHGISAVLITSDAGHILIDGAAKESPVQIARHIRQLGFNVADIKFILNSHEHMDHAGGIAELQKMSGATVLAGKAAVEVLRTGRASKADPQYDPAWPMMPPVAKVQGVADGFVVKVGPLRVTAHATPGHVAGGTSWTWQSREGDVTANMVFADSLNAISTKPFAYRTNVKARTAMEKSIATVAALPCDILISAHPEQSELWERLAVAQQQGRAAFIDPHACKVYAANGSARLVRTLAKEGGQANAPLWSRSVQLEQLFRKEGVSGTFILHDVSGNAYVVHDRQRAETRFVPASTFKIPNSLIALSTGTVANVDAVLPYGGGPTARPAWAQDMSLRDAIKISNVPVYQGVARRIGMAAMQANLQKLNYGNMEAGAAVDTFWLKGPLKISAFEQTVFLDKLAQDQLPLPKSAMAAVRDITRQPGAAGLHAKTGWGPGPAGNIDLGWWVGWVVKDDKVYSFALNVDIPDGSPDKRVALGKAALTSFGLLAE